MKYAICIDLGGTNLKVALVDGLRFSIRAKKVLSTVFSLRKNQLVDALAASAADVVREAGLTKASVCGVGVGVPGPVDARTGHVHFLPNIPGIKRINLKQLLARRLRIPVYVDNDAKLMGIAESAVGAARGYDNVLCITLGTGVGGALILNGALYRGNDNAAGEFGHVPLNESGPACACGGSACLERYVGNATLLKQARAVFPDLASLEDLTRLARAGRPKAVRLWERAGTQLGIALSGAVNLLNLDAVVIGGGVAGAGRYLFGPLSAAINRRAMPVQKRRVKILEARLGNDAGLVGAAVLVMKGNT